ncbi:MAG: hypothetical protein AVO35_04885 [Candidatus Aegiribacteria sp. MLS_C]|nr:MAG: hypothetical protein AVO35_04885 [Candidatus Aegiribacteria sp. MLS_C]
MTRDSFSRIRRRIAAPAMLLAATTVLAAAGGSVMTVPPMDDTYIHLVYGESLISGEPMVYSGSEPSSGLTSPLWLLPSALSALAGRSAGPLILMGCSLVLSLLLLYSMGTLSAMVMVLAGPFLFHSGSGMETSLSCLLVFLVWKWIDEGRGRTGPGGLLLAAAFLTRPELILLVIPMTLSMDRRTPGSIAALAAPSIAAGLIWAAWNMWSTGLPLPSTFYAKLSVSWFTSLRNGLPGLAYSLLITSPLLLFSTVSGVLMLFSRRRTDRRSLALGLTVVLLFLVTFALQPNSYFQMRYYLPALTASVMSSSVWLSGLGGRKRLNTALLVLSMLPGLIVYGERRTGASRDVMCIDVAPARYLEEIALAGEKVAAADIGAVGWISGLEIVDLDGLVTPERLPGPGRQGWEWIGNSADYLLAFPRQYSGLIQEAGDDISFLRGFGTQSSVICGEDSVALWRIE